MASEVATLVGPPMANGPAIGVMATPYTTTAAASRSDGRPVTAGNIGSGLRKRYSNTATAMPTQNQSIRAGSQMDANSGACPAQGPSMRKKNRYAVAPTAAIKPSDRATFLRITTSASSGSTA